MKIKVSKKLIFVTVGILLILQFALLLLYGYLNETNQAPFQIDFDPVLAFFVSWILLCLGIVLIIVRGD